MTQMTYSNVNGFETGALPIPKRILRAVRTVLNGAYGLLLRKPIDTLFHMDWYHNAPRLWCLGIPTVQNPMDMWIKQEIIQDIKPDVIVEAGTHRGGTALYYCMLMSVINPEGRVVTIDVESKAQQATSHPLFQKFGTSIIGDSKSDEVVRRVAEIVRGKKVLVILDSWHEKNHVRREMEIYGKFVNPGSYMIVEDSNVNGHPVGPDYGPGPYEAIEDYMKTHAHEFMIDKAREKMRFTYFPNGFLKKIA